MSFCQSLLIRFLVQSVLMCASVRYERAKRLADLFSLVTAIATFDPGGHILGVVAEELAEDAIFESGAAVLPVLGWSQHFDAFNHRLDAARLALQLNVRQPTLLQSASRQLSVSHHAIAADFRLAGA